MSSLTTILLAIIGPFVSGLCTWLFMRSKYNAETKVVEGDALNSMQKAYNLLVEDMNNKFIAMQEIINEQEEFIRNCKKNHQQHES